MSFNNLNRRDFLRNAGFAAAGLFVGGCASGRSPALFRREEKPNILWISCEDISPDLGCYGDKQAVTPQIDTLASEGCRYNHAFAPFPVCAPTRSSIITGMWPGTIGSMHMRTSAKGYEAVPPSYVRCFTEYLRAAGYYCTNNSKCDYQFRPPFTAWDENSDKAHWLNRPAGTPFFSVFNLTVTHESNLWPIEKVSLHDAENVNLPPYYPNTRITRQNWARYYEVITILDGQVGRLLGQLENEGLADNTVVFFWSDHGRGLPRAKRWPYDSGLRVPLIVRWPGKLIPGSVCDEPVSLMDLGPTVMSIADVKIPEYMQGRPFLASQKAPEREYVFGGRNRMDETSDDFIRTVRDKRYRYIRNFIPHIPYARKIEYMEKMPMMKEMRRLHAEGRLKGPEKLFFRQNKPEEEFYDLLNDPHEINNLADKPEYAGKIAKMRRVLEEWMEQSRDLGAVPEDELIKQMWGGDTQPITADVKVDTDIISGKCVVRLSCDTEGASLGYRPGHKGRWLLYSEPFRIEVPATLQVQAIRIGYLPSGIKTVNI